MNTRKDFQRAAAALKNLRAIGIDEVAVRVAEQLFVEFFQDDNPRFDPSRFLAASGGA
jgi:hypothetical protein